jgi:hypothetical protein
MPRCSATETRLASTKAKPEVGVLLDQLDASGVVRHGKVDDLEHTGGDES